jgi:hypothetical protein
MKVLLVALLAMLLAFSAASPLVEAEEVLEGILVGAFGAAGHKVQGCIQDGEAIFRDIESAIPHFEAAIKHGNKQELEVALALVGHALSLVPEEVKDCEEIPELVKDIEKIAAEFLNPEALIVEIGEKILWHGFSIFKDVRDVVSDFKRGQYEPAGEDIGDIIRIIFLTLKVDPAHEAIDFLEGFFKGALEDDSVEIEECLIDVETIVEAIETTIGHIENDPLSHLEDLFMDLIHLLADIPKSVSECEVSTDELAIFEQWGEELKDVKGMAGRFYKAFLKYPTELTGDFQTAIDSFKNGDFKSSGFSIGDILNTLFIKVSGSYKDSADNAVLFVKSFYTSAFKIDLKLDTCKAALQGPWNSVIDAVTKMSSGKLADIEAGVSALLVAIPALAVSFEHCSEDWPQIEAGLEKLETFINHPASIIVAVSEAAALDPISFPRDAFSIYSAFTSIPVDYEKGGSASGDITKMVLKHMPVDIDAFIKSSE